MWCCALASAAALAVDVPPRFIAAQPRPGTGPLSGVHFEKDDRVSFFFSSLDGNGLLNVCLQTPLSSVTRRPDLNLYPFYSSATYLIQTRG